MVGPPVVDEVAAETTDEAEITLDAVGLGDRVVLARVDLVLVAGF